MLGSASTTKIQNLFLKIYTSKLIFFFLNRSLQKYLHVSYVEVSMGDIFIILYKGNDTFIKFCFTNFDKQLFLIKRNPKILLFYFCNFHKKIKKLLYLINLLTFSKICLSKNYFCLYNNQN